MADELKLVRQRAEGQKALRLWEDEMIQGFFTAVENEIRDGWKDSLGGEQDLREQQYLMFRLQQRLKQCFKTYMATGKLAARELYEIEEKRKR